jgi:hypothetical protein
MTDLASSSDNVVELPTRRFLKLRYGMVAIVTEKREAEKEEEAAAAANA